MALENKYRVHEVAKDFGVGNKEVTDILAKYAKAPKNHMQVLEDNELSLIFEVMTRDNQVADLEGVLERQQQARSKKLAESRQQAAAHKQEASKQQAQQPAKDNKQPSQQQPQQQAQPQQHSRVKQVHRIDTRTGGDVNLDKYDERIDSLVSEKAERMSSSSQKKQKLTKKSDQRAKQQASGKRRQEEQEKMRRLQRQQQQAAAKKVQLKVSIPDEINVGEFAQRMKRTAADVIKELMKLGVMASVSETIDFDTAALVAEEMGAKVEKEVHVTIE